MILFFLLLAFILVAASLAWYLIAHDHGEKEPIGALWIAFGFGFGGGILAAILESIFISSKDLTGGAPQATIFVAALAVGLIEEVCKFVPLALFLYPKRYFNEHTDGIIYFALAGLGFGLPENILYTLQFGSGTGLGRILLVPFFHAALTGMVGYFLVRAKLAGKSKYRVLPLLLFAVILHGLYDYGLASGITVLSYLSMALTLGLSVLFFWLFSVATQRDQQLGLSAVGNNKFCRSCGTPNPDHHLYCVHCGKRA